MRYSGPATPRTLALFIALSIAAATLLQARKTHAFCREVAATPPLNYDPTVSGCFLTDADGDVLPPLFWRNQCVSYSFQKAGSKTIGVADANRIAAEAFAAWSSAPCPGGGTPTILGQQYPAVDCDSAQSQGHNNVIIFRDDTWPYDSSNALGYTTLTIRISTGEIIGAGIEINSYGYTIAADAPPPDAGATKVYDLGSILTHEAGHFLGLAHSADTSAVMYAHYHPGTTTLTPDDIAGICAIYNPDGTRSSAAGPIAATSCPGPPPLGFTSACGSLDSGTYVGSGPLPDGGADGDGGDPPCTGESGCSVGAAGSRVTRPGYAVGLGLGVLGVLARRRGRRSRRTQAASIAGISALAWLGSTALGIGDAKASVSAEALFEQLVEEATAAAVVTPIEQRSFWEGERIATFTRVHIERLVAGQLAGDAASGGDAWIRTMGGAVGDIGQLVEGEASFAVGRPSLVFLGPHLDPATSAPDGPLVVIERAQGQFSIAVNTAGKGQYAQLKIAGDLGALVPPPPDHWTRASKRLPPGTAARYARTVLEDRPLEDAAREIAAVWPRMH